MPRIEVKVKLIPGHSLVRVFIDDVRLNFENNKGSIELETGKMYSLVWFVVGTPSSTYKIEITDPAQSRSTIEYTLDNTGKDGGQVWVNV